MSSLKTSDCQTLDTKTDIGTEIAGNVIWNVELPQLAPDECLPIILNSSFLPTIDSDKSSVNNSDPNMQIYLLNQAQEKAVATPSNNCLVLKTNIEELELPVALENNKKIDKPYFFCNLCPFFCTKERFLEGHVTALHKNGNVAKLAKFKCPACENIFFQKLSLKAHLINDHTVSSSDLNKIINDVIKVVGKVDDKPEENCKSEVDSLSKLSLHSEKILTGDEIENIKVPKNSETINLPTVDILPNNSKKVTNLVRKSGVTMGKLIGKKAHICPIFGCKVYLENAKNLEYHVKCHSDDPNRPNTFNCPECNEQFAVWKPLTGHLWRQHKIDMDLYSCDKCDYKTYSLGKLNNIHRLIHNDSKPFLCNACPRGFKNSKQLRNHKMLHKQKTDNHKFSCDVCSKTFSNRRQLKVHTDSVHKKIKPFLCNFCGYKGATRSALRMHIRQHTGEKPFACENCSYTTADHNSLRRHKMRHSGEMPYKCIHCDYACIQSSTYKVHLKTKHPGLEQDLLYSCTECLFKTINKSMFKTHVSTVHNNSGSVIELD